MAHDHSDNWRSSLFEIRDFRVYLGATFLASLAVQAQSVAVGWQVYKLTRSPLALGYVGLVQFLPALLMMLPAGAVADRYDRRTVMCISGAFRALTAAAFVALSIASVEVIWPFYATLAVFATARTFAAPAADSLLPRVVPESAIHRRGRMVFLERANRNHCGAGLRRCALPLGRLQHTRCAARSSS